MEKEAKKKNVEFQEFSELIVETADVPVELLERIEEELENK